MNVNVFTDQRLSRTPNGRVWSQRGITSAFCQRYLTVFDEVQLITRVQDVPHVGDDWYRVDGPHITVEALPFYVGPVQYTLKMRAIERIVRHTITTGNAYLLRVPSQSGSVAASILLRRQQPFAVEVCADPFDIFSPGSVNHPLRSFFQWQWSRNLRWQCQQATAASYVTAQALQKRYPPGPSAFTTHYSSIELPDEAFVQEARVYQNAPIPARLVTIGMLEQLIKAPDVLIDAVAQGVKNGLDLKLVFVGDGKHRPELEQRVIDANLANQVSFLGQLQSGEAVRTALDKADLFVLPSRQEGVPRAMIEAMARGLPCIGSTIGGIPELLPPEDMVPPNDVDALAAKIQEVVRNPARLTTMAARNLVRAHDYTDEILQRRRTEFYQYLKNATAEWQRTNAT